MGRKLTTESFIKKARSVHGSKYNYSKIEYKNIRTKVCIICQKHGEFWQRPDLHLEGHGCPSCGYESTKEAEKLTTEEFVKKARKTHGDKYDYSKVNYVNTKTKVCIICPEHGEFWVKPNDHLSRKFGCHKCGWIKEGEKLRKTTENFIKEATEKFGNKFDYSKVVYKTNADKVCIICHEKDAYGIEIGEFWQTPANHLTYGLSGTILPLTTDRFIKRAKSIHGNKYDYSKCDVKNANEKVIITCPVHGDFKQTPANHLSGRGCQKCKNKSVLELITRTTLCQIGVKFEEQKRFNFLGRLSLDFYIPSLGVAIECQGQQHFCENRWGKLEDIIKRDKCKKELCEENSIKMYYLINKKYSKMNEEIYNENNTYNIKELKNLIIKLQEEK